MAVGVTVGVAVGVVVSTTASVAVGATIGADADGLHPAVTRSAHTTRIIFPIRFIRCWSFLHGLHWQDQRNAVSRTCASAERRAVTTSLLAKTPNRHFDDYFDNVNFIEKEHCLYRHQTKVGKAISVSSIPPATRHGRANSPTYSGRQVM